MALVIVIYNLGDAFGSGCSGLAAARLPLANQALRIPIAIFLFELFLVRCFVISFFIWII